MNYENDPDLAAAMRFDSETNGGDEKLASQKRAEEHYLKYLESSDDAYQRAWVYSQLGVLFSTNYNGEKGEQADYERAGEYFEQAIEEANGHIAPPSIRARLNRITSNHSPGERIKMRIEAYQWLDQFDKASMKAEWLPHPSGLPPTDRELEIQSGRIEMLKSAAAWNMTGEALSTDRPAHYLQMVIEQLPGTEAAAMAAKAKNRAEQRKAAGQGLP